MTRLSDEKRAELKRVLWDRVGSKHADEKRRLEREYDLALHELSVATSEEERAQARELMGKADKAIASLNSRVWTEQQAVMREFMTKGKSI